MFFYVCHCYCLWQIPRFWPHHRFEKARVLYTLVALQPVGPLGVGDSDKCSLSTMQFSDYLGVHYASHFIMAKDILSNSPLIYGFNEAGSQTSESGILSYVHSVMDSVSWPIFVY